MVKKVEVDNMVERMPEIQGFVENALAYLNVYFKSSIVSEETELSDVYPYIFQDYKKKEISYREEDIFDYMRVLHESFLLICCHNWIKQIYHYLGRILEYVSYF